MPSVKKFVVLFLLLFCGQIFAVPTAEVEYFYSQDGTLIGRAVNGKRLNYEYDLKGQLLAVKDTSGKVIEQYVYDPAGNILSKTIENKTTTFTYDEANQLVSSTYEGKTTTYEYDAAGRLVREGSKIYSYGYLDKILEVQENGKQVAAFDYHVDGQVASATYSDKSESFVWDGLALIRRNENTFINEPHVTGGNPILSSKDGVMFNDMLGNTLSVNGKTVDMTAFGETSDQSAMFTGKPYIGELGYAFLFRNYRADNGKWSSADPLGYPDGWNNFAYINNGPTSAIDWLGTLTIKSGSYTSLRRALESYVNSQTPTYNDYRLAADCYAISFAGLWGNTWDMAEHYYEGSGSDWRLDHSIIESEFINDISSISSDIESYLNGLSLSSDSGSVKFSSDWEPRVAAITGDLYLALRNFSWCVDGSAIMNSNGDISVVAGIRIYDYYDFSKSSMYESWYRLAEVGLATPYNVYGGYYFSFTIKE